MIIYMKESVLVRAIIIAMVGMAVYMLIAPIPAHAKTDTVHIKGEVLPAVGFVVPKMKPATTTDVRILVITPVQEKVSNDAPIQSVSSSDDAKRAQLTELVKLLTQYLALLKSKTV